MTDRGADANAVNLLGDNALDVAAAVGHPEVRSYLEDRTEARRSRSGPNANGDYAVSGTELFLGAVREGDRDAVLDMLGGGVDVDATDGVGATALMLAAIAGNEDIAKILVDKGGADINARDRINGWTALMQVLVLYVTCDSLASYRVARNAGPISQVGEIKMVRKLLSNIPGHFLWTPRSGQVAAFAQRRFDDRGHERLHGSRPGDSRGRNGHRASPDARQEDCGGHPARDRDA